MARDYKNVTEAGMQKKTRAKKKKSAPAEKTIPGWLWLVSGVVIGGFFSFIVYLKLSVPIEAEITDAKRVEIEKKEPVEKKPVKSVEQKIKKVEEKSDGELEFYKILPNRESFFPNNEAENHKKESAKNQESKNTSSTNVKSVPGSSSKTSYIYTLQVGSFLAFKDADTRKANLAMLGIGSRIHAIKTRNRTHYRVLVGPYTDIKRVNKIDAEMKENNIKTLLLREKG